MTLIQVGGYEVEVDSEGFLKNHNDWTPELAHALAGGIDLELGERHFIVIEFMRSEFEKTGTPPTIRSIGKRSGVAIKELYQLFPKGPAKKAALVSGLPKPKGCI